MNNLKRVLAEREITGTTLSKACNINLPTVYNLIAGRQYAWPGYRKKIAAFLEMSEEEIFGDDIEVR